MCAGLEDESALQSIFWLRIHVFTDVNETFSEGFFETFILATFIFLSLHRTFLDLGSEDVSSQFRRSRNLNDRDQRHEGQQHTRNGSRFKETSNLSLMDQVLLQDPIDDLNPKGDGLPNQSDHILPSPGL